MKPLAAWRCGTSGFTPDAGKERRVLVVLLGIALLPAVAHGQSRIVGQVTDNTGGVLPGVAVEAASPVLIEGSRIAITDSTPSGPRGWQTTTPPFSSTACNSTTSAATARRSTT